MLTFGLTRLDLSHRIELLFLRATMYRLFLIIFLLIILYFLLRQMFRGLTSPTRDSRGISANSAGRDEDQDQMIEDPVCHTFVPKRIAVIEEMGGRTYCFCSKECAVTFRSQHPV
jgi:YHS domain-containing protein